MQCKPIRDLEVKQEVVSSQLIDGELIKGIKHRDANMDLLSIPFLMIFHMIFASGFATAMIPHKDEYRVTGLEAIEPAFALFDGESYAGYIPTAPIGTTPSDGSSLFFWMFEPNDPIDNDSLSVWMNGGPGCSSFDGMLFEHGPVMLPHIPAGPSASSKYDKLSFNPYSWTNATRMLYMEQPVGTGFSVGREPQDETDVASDFYNVLQRLYAIFPHLKEVRLFLFGESYAGQYVPAMAHYIHQQNKQTDDKIHLAGIGLGNGWFDSTIQGPAVIDYAWWRGLIDTSTQRTLHAVWDEYQPRGDTIPQDVDAPFHPFTTPDEIGLLWPLLKAAGSGAVTDDGTVLPGPNAYETTTWDYYPQLYDDDSTITLFFNKREVQEALHAIRPRDKTILWQQCIPGSGRRQRRRLHMMDNDRPMRMERYIADLLDDAKIRVLVYNGDRDMTTCGPATEIALDNMEWRGQSNWNMMANPGANRGLWRVPHSKHLEPAGYVKTYKNLEFITVYNSGHLMPTNVPAAGLDLVSRMVTNKPFLDVPLSIYTPATFGLSEHTSPGKLQKTAKTAVLNGEVSASGLILILASLLLGFALGYFASRMANDKGTSNANAENGEASALVKDKYGAVAFA